MKNKKIETGNDCERSAEIVPYIYRELPVAELERFDHHLSGCEACRDEFAAVSFSRFSVYEWQREEFAPLATPDFAAAFAPKAVRVDQTRWFDAIRGWLALPHRQLLAGGFAAILVGIFFGTVYIASFDSSSGDDITSVVAPAVPAPVIDQVPSAEVANLPNSDPPEDVSEKEVVPATVKPATRRSTPKQRSVGNKVPQVVAATVPAADLPRLTEDDDDLDYGLRLADLVAEIDTIE